MAKKYGATVDNIYDLPRVLRVPNTFNCKGLDGEKPIPVVAHRLSGKPPHLREIDTILLAQGVYAEDGDTGSHEQISKPEDWTYGVSTCRYVAKIIGTIPTDTPKAGRHQWMLSKCVKLASAARLGCISEADFDRATTALYARLVALRDETCEVVPYQEVPAAMIHAVEKVGCKTDEETNTELGDHCCCLNRTGARIIRDGSAGARIIRGGAR